MHQVGTSLLITIMIFQTRGSVYGEWFSFQYPTEFVYNLKPVFTYALKLLLKRLLPKDIFEWLNFAFHSWEALGSDLGRWRLAIWWRFSWLSSVPPSQCNPCHQLKPQGHLHFLSNSFQFFIHPFCHSM